MKRWLVHPWPMWSFLLYVVGGLMLLAHEVNSAPCILQANGMLNNTALSIYKAKGQFMDGILYSSDCAKLPATVCTDLSSLSVGSRFCVVQLTGTCFCPVATLLLKLFAPKSVPLASDVLTRLALETTCLPEFYPSMPNCLGDQLCQNVTATLAKNVQQAKTLVVSLQPYYPSMRCVRNLAHNSQFQWTVDELMSLTRGLQSDDVSDILKIINKLKKNPPSCVDLSNMTAEALLVQAPSIIRDALTAVSGSNKTSLLRQYARDLQQVKKKVLLLLGSSLSDRGTLDKQANDARRPSPTDFAVADVFRPLTNVSVGDIKAVLSDSTLTGCYGDDELKQVSPDIVCNTTASDGSDPFVNLTACQQRTIREHCHDFFFSANVVMPPSLVARASPSEIAAECQGKTFENLKSYIEQFSNVGWELNPSQIQALQRCFDQAMTRQKYSGLDGKTIRQVRVAMRHVAIELIQRNFLTQADKDNYCQQMSAGPFLLSEQKRNVLTFCLNQVPVCDLNDLLNQLSTVDVDGLYNDALMSCISVFCRKVSDPAARRKLLDRYLTIKEGCANLTGDDFKAIACFMPDMTDGELTSLKFNGNVGLAFAAIIKEMSDQSVRVSVGEHGPAMQALIDAAKMRVIPIVLAASQAAAAGSRPSRKKRAATWGTIQCSSVIGPSLWPVDQLNNLSQSVFTSCPSALNVDGYVNEQVSAVAKLAVQAVGDPCMWNRTYVQQLGVIVFGVDVANISCMDFNDTQTIASVGGRRTKRPLDAAKYQAVFGRWCLQTTGKTCSLTVSTMTADTIMTIGVVSCGVNYISMKTAEYDKASKFIGGIDCYTPSALRQFANSAKILYGNGSTIDISAVTNIGTVIAGMDTAFFNALSPEKVSAITPQAIWLIQPSIIATLTVDQIQAFTPAQAIALNDAQLQSINGTIQFDIIMQKRKMTMNSTTTWPPTTVGPSTVLPMRSGTGLATGQPGTGVPPKNAGGTAGTYVPMMMSGGTAPPGGSPPYGGGVSSGSGGGGGVGNGGTLPPASGNVTAANPKLNSNGPGGSPPGSGGTAPPPPPPGNGTGGNPPGTGSPPPPPPPGNGTGGNPPGTGSPPPPPPPGNGTGGNPPGTGSPPPPPPPGNGTGGNPPGTGSPPPPPPPGNGTGGNPPGTGSPPPPPPPGNGTGGNPPGSGSAASSQPPAMHPAGDARTSVNPSKQPGVGGGATSAAPPGGNVLSSNAPPPPAGDASKLPPNQDTPPPAGPGPTPAIPAVLNKDNILAYVNRLGQDLSTDEMAKRIQPDALDNPIILQQLDNQPLTDNQELALRNMIDQLFNKPGTTFDPVRMASAGKLISPISVQKITSQQVLSVVKQSVFQENRDTARLYGPRVGQLLAGANTGIDFTARMLDCQKAVAGIPATDFMDAIKNRPINNDSLVNFTDIAFTERQARLLYAKFQSDNPTVDVGKMVPSLLKILFDTLPKSMRQSVQPDSVKNMDGPTAVDVIVGVSDSHVSTQSVDPAATRTFLPLERRLFEKVKTFGFDKLNQNQLITVMISGLLTVESVKVIGVEICALAHFPSAAVLGRGYELKSPVLSAIYEICKPGFDPICSGPIDHFGSVSIGAPAVDILTIKDSDALFGYCIPNFCRMVHYASQAQIEAFLTLVRSHLDRKNDLGDQFMNMDCLLPYLGVKYLNQTNDQAKRETICGLIACHSCINVPSSILREAMDFCIASGVSVKTFTCPMGMGRGRCLMESMTKDYISHSNVTCGPAIINAVDVLQATVMDCALRAQLYDCVKSHLSLTDKNSLAQLSSLVDQFSDADWNTVPTKNLCGLLSIVSSVWTNWDYFQASRTALGLKPVAFCTNRAAVLARLRAAEASADCTGAPAKRRKRDTTALTCDQVNQMGYSVTQLSASQLQTLSTTDFVNCAQFLGRVIGFTTDQWTALAAVAKQAYGSDCSQWTTEQITSAAGIVTGLSSDEISNLKLNDLNAIQAVGLNGVWSVDQMMKAFACVKKNYKNSNIATFTSAELSSLGNIICGATGEEIGTLQAKEVCGAVEDIGQLHTCEDQQLQALANQEKVCLGSDVTKWSPSVIEAMGSLIGGLTKTDISMLTQSQIEAIPISAIAEIPPIQFSGFTAAQLEYFSSYQAAVVTSAQYQSLDQSRQAVLEKKLSSVSDDLALRPSARQGGKNVCSPMSASLLPLVTASLAFLLRI